MAKRTKKPEPLVAESEHLGLVDSFLSGGIQFESSNGLRSIENAATDRTAGQSRGLGRAAADLGLGVAQGLSGLVEAGGTLYGAITGRMDNPARVIAADTTRSLAGLESDQLKARRQVAQRSIDGAEGEVGKALAAIRAYGTDPALLTQEIAKSAGPMGAAGLAGRGAAAGLRGLGAGAGLQSGAAVGTAVGANAALHGGDIASNTYDRARKEGLSEAQALAAAREAYVSAAALSGVSAALPGGTALDRALVGKAGRGMSGNFLSRGLTGAAGEGIQEGAFEEGGGQFAGNMALQGQGSRVGNFQGVGQAAGTGFVLGAAMGGPAGLMKGQSDAPVIRADQPTDLLNTAPAARTPAQAAGEQMNLPGLQGLGMAPIAAPQFSELTAQDDKLGGVDPRQMAMFDEAGLPARGADFQTEREYDLLGRAQQKMEVDRLQGVAELPATEQVETGVEFDPQLADPADPANQFYAQPEGTVRDMFSGETTEPAAQPAPEVEQMARAATATSGDTSALFTQDGQPAVDAVKSVDLARSQEQEQRARVAAEIKGMQDKAKSGQVEQPYLMQTLEKTKGLLGGEGYLGGKQAQMAAGGTIKTILEAPNPLELIRTIHENLTEGNATGKGTNAKASYAPQLAKVLATWHEQLTGDTLNAPALPQAGAQPAKRPDQPAAVAAAAGPAGQPPAAVAGATAARVGVPANGADGVPAAGAGGGGAGGNAEVRAPAGQAVAEGDAAGDAQRHPLSTRLSELEIAHPGHALAQAPANVRVALKLALNGGPAKKYLANIGAWKRPQSTDPVRVAESLGFSADMVSLEADAETLVANIEALARGDDPRTVPPFVGIEADRRQAEREESPVATAAAREEERARQSERDRARRTPAPQVPRALNWTTNRDLGGQVNRDLTDVSIEGALKRDLKAAVKVLRRRTGEEGAQSLADQIEMALEEPGVSVVELQGMRDASEQFNEKPGGGPLFTESQPRGEAPVDLISSIRAGDTNGVVQQLAASTDAVVAEVAQKLAGVDALATKIQFGGVSVAQATAEYDPQTDTIHIRSTRHATEMTVLHELVHAYTVAALRGAVDLTPAQQAAVDDLRRVYTMIRTRSPSAKQYGLSSIEEFAAEAWSNPEFQDLLRNTMVDQRPLWSRFVDAVRRLLGMSPRGPGPRGGLEAVTSALDTIITAPKVADATSDTGDTVQSIMDIDLREKAREVKDEVALRAPDRMGRTLASALSLRQLAGEFSDQVPSLKAFAETVLEKEAHITGKSIDFDPLVRELEALPAKDALSNLLYDSTVEGLYPNRTFAQQPHVDKMVDDMVKAEGISKQDARQVLAERQARLNAQWNSLPPAAQKMYDRVLKTFDERRAALLAALERHITTLQPDKVQRDDLIRQLREEFGRAQGPYFPLMRFGDYVVAAYDRGTGELKFYGMAENAAEQAQLAQQFESDKNVRVVRTMRDEFVNKVGNSSDFAFINKLHGLLDKTEGLDGDVKDALHKEMQGIFVASLPEMHARQRFLPRKKVAGFTKNAPRTLAQALVSSVRYEGTLRFNPVINAALADMRRETSGKPTDSKAWLVEFETAAGKEVAIFGDQHQYIQAIASRFGDLKDYKLTELTQSSAEPLIRAAGGTDADVDAARGFLSREHADNLNLPKQVVNEVQTRMKSLVDQRTPPAIQLAGNVTYLMYLGMSPSFVLTNLTQNPMVTLPMLAARYGFGRASKEMSRASKAVGRDMMGAVKAGWRTGDFDLANIKHIDADERAMLEYLRDRGLLDLTQAVDLGQVASNSNATWQKVMQYGTMAGHYSEVYNRVVAALTAYRLSAGRESSEAARRAYTETVVERTHGDYTSANKPGIMTRSPLTRLAFQFRNYAFTMMYFVGRAMRDAMKGETEEVKAEARRLLAYTFGTGLVLGGVKALPVWGPIVVLMTLLGVDDPEEEAAAFAKTLLGDAGGTALMKGGLAALGGDLSGRIGMGDIVPGTELVTGKFRRSDNTNEQTVTEIVAQMVMGPSLGVLTGMARGVGFAQDGEWWKAGEQFAPKAVRDPMQAARWSQDGITTRTGDVLMQADTIGVGDLVWKALGVQPSEVAAMYEGRGLVIRKMERAQQKKAALTLAYRAATASGDQEGASEIADEAAAAGVSATDLRRAVSRQADRQAILDATGGRAASKAELDMLIEAGETFDN